jgi:hypothetical protein
LSKLPLVSESKTNSNTSEKISIRSAIIDANQPMLLVTPTEMPRFTTYHKARIVEAVVVVLQIRVTRIGKVVPAGTPVNKTVPESCMVTFMFPVVPT